jgi:hypothetical protein
MEVLGLMPNASNYTFLVRLADGGSGDGETFAIYKPRAGETPLWDFPPGTLCLREVAAYEVSHAIGWPSVPPTVLREGPHGAGSVQVFVRFDPWQHYFTLRDLRADDLMRVALFDAVANNADRKSGHCLLDEDGHMWVIDHGVCFHPEPKLRTVIWDFAGEPIPEPLAANLAAFADRLSEEPLRSALAGLLDPLEVKILRERTTDLLDSGLFPTPGLGRPYPWPPV